MRLRVGVRVGGDGRRGVGVGDRHGHTLAGEGAAGLVGLAQLRAGVAAHGVRQRLALELRQRGRAVGLRRGRRVPVVGRARPGVAEALGERRGLLGVVPDLPGRGVQPGHGRDVRRDGGRHAHGLVVRADDVPVVAVAAQAHAEGPLHGGHRAARGQVAAVLLDGGDPEVVAGEPRRDGGDRGGGGVVLRVVLRRGEEVPVGRARRVGQGGDVLLERGQPAAWGEVDAERGGGRGVRPAEPVGPTGPGRGGAWDASPGGGVRGRGYGRQPGRDERSDGGEREGPSRDHVFSSRQAGSPLTPRHAKPVCTGRTRPRSVYLPSSW